MKIGILGCGNMSSAIVKCIHSKRKEIQFNTFTPSKTRSVKLSKEVNGVHHSELSSFLRENYDLVVIACKPQQVEALSLDVENALAGKVIVSILAGISIDTISRLFNSDFICRVMPNTPSEFGEGISLIHSSVKVLDETNSKIMNLFKNCGLVISTKTEEELDELTVFSGSGPAYIYRFALAYQRDLLNRGYSETESRSLLNQLFVGTSVLMSNSEDSLSDLVDKVSSKKGVTLEAVKILNEKNLDEIVSLSTKSAHLRAKQIAQEIKF